MSLTPRGIPILWPHMKKREHVQSMHAHAPEVASSTALGGGVGAAGGNQSGGGGGKSMLAGRLTGAGGGSWKMREVIEEGGYDIRVRDTPLSTYSPRKFKAMYTQVPL